MTCACEVEVVRLIFSTSSRVTCDVWRVTCDVWRCCDHWMLDVRPTRVTSRMHRQRTTHSVMNEISILDVLLWLWCVSFDLSSIIHHDVTITIIIIIIIIISRGLLSRRHTIHHARLRKRTSSVLAVVLTPFSSCTRQSLPHFFPDFSFKSGFCKFL